MRTLFHIRNVSNRFQLMIVPKILMLVVNNITINNPLKNENRKECGGILLKFKKATEKNIIIIYKVTEA